MWPVERIVELSSNDKMDEFFMRSPSPGFKNADEPLNVAATTTTAGRRRGDRMGPVKGEGEFLIETKITYGQFLNLSG